MNQELQGKLTYLRRMSQAKQLKDNTIGEVRYTYTTLEDMLFTYTRADVEYHCENSETKSIKQAAIKVRESSVVERAKALLKRQPIVYCFSCKRHRHFKMFKHHYACMTCGGS